MCFYYDSHYICWEKICKKLNRKSTLKLKIFFFLTIQSFCYASFTGKSLKFINNSSSNVSGLASIAHWLFNVSDMNKNSSSTLSILQRKFENIYLLLCATLHTKWSANTNNKMIYSRRLAKLHSIFCFSSKVLKIGIFQRIYSSCLWPSMTNLTTW